MAFQCKLILSLFLLLFVSGCGKIQGVQNQVMVMVDVTDDDPSAVPSRERILDDLQKRIDLTSHPENGLDFSIALFDDLSGGSPAHAALEPETGNSAMNNPVTRKRKVEEFLTRLGSTIDQALSDVNIDKTYSKLYSKLCSTLSNQPATQSGVNLILIYSDMIENSQLLSFYKNQDFLTDPSAVEKLYTEILKPSCGLPDLHGYQFILYTHRKPSTDVLVTRSEKFWKTLLEARGAQVSINP